MIMDMRMICNQKNRSFQECNEMQRSTQTMDSFTSQNLFEFLRLHLFLFLLQWKLTNK